MALTELFKMYSQHAVARESRSTVLQPLVWLIPILTPSLVLSGIYGIPFWIQLFLACSLGLILILFIGSYIYFIKSDPDYLRSERFSLSKMAIERNILGDSKVGFEMFENAQLHPTSKAHELLETSSGDGGER